MTPGTRVLPSSSTSLLNIASHGHYLCNSVSKPRMEHVKYCYSHSNGSVTVLSILICGVQNVSDP